MPDNPGERHPRSRTESSVQAVRGTIAYFDTTLVGLLVLLAVTLALNSLVLPAVAVAFVAGRIGGRR